MTGILSREQSRALCERILEQSSADSAEVRLSSGLDGNTRFAGNQITTAADATNVEATIVARFGTRSGSVAFNSFEDRDIARASARVEQLALLVPENDERMPFLEPQEYEPNDAFFESTAGLSAQQRVDATLGVIAPAANAGMVATGFLHRVAGSSAVANTAGLFAYHRSTLVAYTTTVRTSNGEGSGWAGTTHNDWTRADAPVALAERAIDKARRSVGATAIEPGAYTVLLEPTAVGNLVRVLGFALGARAADEGRSFFSRVGGGTRLGEQVIDERLSLISDPADPQLLSRPFTGEGEPLRRTVWIDNGVLVNLSATRYWAERQGLASTPPDGGLKMTGGEGTVEELVAGIDRGLLVTRFWYVRRVDSRSLSYTGLTRDCVFSIEGGRLTGAVKNLRFNESVVRMLNNVEAVGAPVRVVASESGGLGAPVVVPPLVVRDFRFTSVSDAV